MKILKILSIVLFLSSLAFLSCDKIDPPYITEGNPIVSNKKVLLEEFTGHKCPNCPQGSKIAHDLQGIYGDKLILISVHAGFFATPNASGHYTEDFRTTTGDELNTDYNVQSYPSGMINRTSFDDKVVLGKSAWATAVNELIAQPEQALLTITHTYTASTKKLDITVATEVVRIIEDPVGVCIYITGDTIAPQENNDPTLGPSPVWEDYDHHDMLVQSIGGTYGEPVNNSELLMVDETYESIFSGTLKDGWPAGKCKIVAFIYNINTKEVIQAEEVDII